MKKYFSLFIFLLVCHINSYAQPGTGINTKNPDPFAFLHINETVGITKFKSGLIITRYTTLERDENLTGLSAADNGLIIFNTTQNCYNYWKQNATNFPTGTWINMCSDLFGFYFIPDCFNAVVSTKPLTVGSNQPGTVTVPIWVSRNGVINAINQTINGVTFTMAAATVTSSSTSMLINFTDAPTAKTDIYMPIRANDGSIICNVYIPVK